MLNQIWFNLYNNKLILYNWNIKNQKLIHNTKYKVNQENKIKTLYLSHTTKCITKWCYPLNWLRSYIKTGRVRSLYHLRIRKSTVNVSMGLEKLLLRMETSTKANFTTVYCTEKASSFGAMVLSTRANLLITELREMAFIDGLTEAFMKDKLRMDSGMALENTRSKKRPTKVNGFRVKNLAKAK